MADTQHPRIYTKTGDAGDTSLFDGTRVAKSDARVDAYGHVDELCAWLGLVVTATEPGDIPVAIARVQRELFAVGARLADPRHRIAPRLGKADLGPEAAARLESEIDRFETELDPLRHFILPGGAEAGARLHVARAVCRRAERAVVALGAEADSGVVVYLNRLSDWLFVLARVVNRRAGVREVEW